MRLRTVCLLKSCWRARPISHSRNGRVRFFGSDIGSRWVYSRLRFSTAAFYISINSIKIMNINSILTVSMQIIPKRRPTLALDLLFRPRPLLLLRILILYRIPPSTSSKFWNFLNICRPVEESPCLNLALLLHKFSSFRISWSTPGWRLVCWHNWVWTCLQPFLLWIFSIHCQITLFRSSNETCKSIAEYQSFLEKISRHKQLSPHFHYTLLQ